MVAPAEAQPTGRTPIAQQTSAANSSPPPELPASRTADSVERDFVRHRAVLSREAWDELRERAAARWVSEYTVVLSAAAQVLAMWSKSPRFSVTVEFATRPESRLATAQGSSRCAV